MNQVVDIEGIEVVASLTIPATITIRDAFPSLTFQQARVTALLVQGLDNKEIARELGISPRTVEDHRSNIYEKIGIRDAAGITYALFGSPKIVP